MASIRDPMTLPRSAPPAHTLLRDHPPAPSARPGTSERGMADALRALAIDAVEAAGSGDAGLPMGMADVAAALWTRAHKFDATDPRWPDRDRFVLSPGHGAMLLYGLLHLTGHAGFEADALRGFRQLHGPATGTPEYGEHPAIEATSGPPGQGLAMAVGMALAERLMAARFGRSLVDHRTWALVADTDLMQGVSHEAASLAGHLRLERLTVLWDDNRATFDGGVELSSSDDLLKRFAAAGWATKRVDGHAPGEIAAALSFAVRSRKPTIIACQTLLGFAASVPGAARQALDWPYPPFELPDELAAAWRRAGSRGTPARRAWLKRLANHPLRTEFERVVAGRLPEAWHEATAALKAELAEAHGPAATRHSSPAAPRHGSQAATRHSSQATLDALSAALPELVGGAADRTAPTHAKAAGQVAVAPGAYAGRFVHYGMRDNAMAACVNGMALHGGVLPYAGSFLACTDAMRPALRLAALMRQRVVHVLTHDSIAVGADGPAHQPVEHLAMLRATPGLFVLRPADAIETVECWELAIRRADGPSLLVLSCQDVPTLRPDAGENRCARGGYVLVEADGARQATLVATGAEVATAVAARALLAEHGIAAAVVSLPCWELFAQQDEGVRDGVLGSALRVGVEAACGFGWERWLGPGGIFIGMTGYGASAPAETLFRHFGITPEAVAQAVRKRLQPPTEQGS